MYFTSKSFEEKNKNTGQAPLNFTSKSIESIRQNSNPTGYVAPRQGTYDPSVDAGIDLSKPTYPMIEPTQAPIQPKKPSLLSKLRSNINNFSNYIGLNDVAKQVGNVQNKKIDELTKSKLGAAEIGAINSAGLGIGEQLSKRISPNLPTAYDQAKENHPFSYGAGEFAGYLAPGIGASKLAKPVTNFATKKIASRLGKQVIEGAIIGAGLDTTQGVIAGDNAGQLGKRVVTGAVMGAGADVGLNALGKVAKSAFPAWKTTFESKIPDVLPKTKPIQTPIKGKFTVKNTALDKAQNAYDQAIQTIQNRFQTNQLTPAEIPLIKTELGIDLPKLADDLAIAKTEIRPIGENARMSRVVGINDVPVLNKNGATKLEPILKPIQATQKLGTINTPLKVNNVTTPLKTELNPSIGATDRTKLSVGIVTGENQAKTTFKDKRENLYARTIDTNIAIRNKISEDAYVLATNSKKVGGTVGNIVSNNLVDMKGNTIGESLSSISKDIPKNEEQDFINYVLQKHNIDRAREGKPIDPSWNSEQSLKATSLIDQQKPQYKALSDRLNKFLNDFEGEWGNKSGLVSDELWTNLQTMYKNYVPTQRGFSELEQGIAKTQGRGFVGQDNALNKATGSDRDVINPIENIIKLVDRTVRTARYNEVGQSMLESIRKNPTIGKYAEILADDVKINPNVNNIVTVLEKGKEVNVQINDKNLLNSLQGLYKSVDLNGLESAAKSFNNVFKSLITTKNPLFTVRNISRDLPTGYINGSEKNPVKYLYDWAKSIGDLATNSKVAQQYRGLGGESSNFVNSDKTFKSANQIMNRKLKTDEFGQITGSKGFNPIYKGLKFIGDKIEKVNNATESAPRLAEFKRVLSKTNDVQKALFASGEITTNFSRGGDVTKKLDNVLVPYLNAGFQGLDKLARQLDPRNPKQMLATLIKGGVGIGAPTVVFHYMNQDNPYYQELDNRTKDSYFLIPNTFGEKDNQGNAKTFIKIPKAREYGVLFSTLFQRLERVSAGEENALKGFGNTVATNFSPSNPLENNIISPLFNLKANKDFASRNIVPQGMVSDGRSKYLQYDEKSSEITKKIAELANKQGIDLSPKQMDYLIKSYTGVIGQLGLPASTKSTMSGGNTLSKLTKPVTTQFISDPLYSNQTVTDFYDNLDKTTRLATDKNLNEKLPSKLLTPEEQRKSIFTKASAQISDINKEIKLADAKNDTVKVKELKQKIIDLAKATNDRYKTLTIVTTK